MHRDKVNLTTVQVQPDAERMNSKLVKRPSLERALTPQRSQKTDGADSEVSSHRDKNYCNETERERIRQLWLDLKFQAKSKYDYSIAKKLRTNYPAKYRI